MLALHAVFTVALAALPAAGVVEQRRHLARLESVPVRVLVNGIRGKSSITRLVAGALRGGGLAVGAGSRAARADTPCNRAFRAPKCTKIVTYLRVAAGRTSIR
jgi:gamma-polyglutamate synthase